MSVVKYSSPLGALHRNNIERLSMFLSMCPDEIVKVLKERYLWVTHKKLLSELDIAVKLWARATNGFSEHENEKDEIMCEDIQAKYMDSLEKLITFPSLYTEQHMYGRDKEIQDIKAQLLKHEKRTLSFTVICGDVGIGKTMLAQCLLADTEVFNRFRLIDWINCHNIEAIINDDTCIKTIHTIMLELFTAGSTYMLMGSALLIFDGWTPNFNYNHFYDALLRVDKIFRPACVKIIVTTTTYISTLDDTSKASYSKVYDVLPPTCVQLLGLSIEESRYMFESLAFSPNVSSEEKTRIIDSEIGSKTLNLCSANPCVINTVASILSTKSTIDEWVHFVDVVWPSIPSPLKMITSTFNLVAFKRLPFLIKRCLLFCSLFPKDYEFSRVDLNLWLARELKFEDDIEDDEEPLDVELIGDQYLQMLHKIGYFVEHGKDEDGTLTYKMPIFSYEFLKFIAKLDYSEYQSGGTGMHHVDPTTIRHVSFIVDDTSWRPPIWHEAKKLQSVLFLGKHCESLTGLEDIIASLKYLQILGGDISERLLSETGEFEHLRSLKVRSTDQKLLKKIITRTRNLRLLDLGHLTDVHVLPKELHNLQCLRHLYVRFKLNNQASPNSGEGELPSLTIFNVFMTGQDDSKINTLVYYDNIVENEMIDNGKWNETLIDDKIQNVALCWQSPNHGNDDIVVKTLEAPISLTVRYRKRGLTNPRFLGLVSLQIMDCHECQRIPSFSRLPKLKSFKLWNLDALEYIEYVDYRKDEPYFVSLRSLVLVNLPEVKAWNENNIPEMKIIPHLTELQICSTALEHLPLFKGTIVSLEVKDISVQLLRSLVSSLDSKVTTIAAIESTATMLKRLSVSAVHGLERVRIELPMFESLIIRQCHELTKLVLQPGSNFWSLQLHECGKLRKLWNHFPQQAKLGEIEIHGCEELDLQEIGTLIPLKNHLRNLTLANFEHLKSLPTGLDSFTVLETISISWIYNLKELPEGIGRLENLRRVVVQNCPRLITIPESLGHLMNKLTALEVKFRSCRALRQLPESFPRNQPSRLIIKGCPKLERSMSYVGSV